MTKLLLLLFISISSFADNIKQLEYVSLADTKVYDVEIIVFAYNTPHPNKDTYSNKMVFHDEKAITLTNNSENLPFLKENTKNLKSEELTVPLNSEPINKHALVWFEINKEAYQLKDVWEKLIKKDSITPLIHKAWRQPETSFDEPQQVKLNNIDTDIDLLTLTEEILYPENGILGYVALSKGRYLHFGHQLNLFKIFKQTNTESNKMLYEQDITINNIIFSLEERKQIKSGELHYFDSPWLATIVKVTQFTGEPNDE